MDRVQIAVVGLGRMGKRHVHTLLHRTPFAQVVAVCTNQQHEIEWAQQNEEYKTFGIKVFEDYDTMLDQSGLQAVWISTSTDVHSSQTLAAMKKGKHVLCEKPLSTDLEEVRMRLCDTENMRSRFQEYRRNRSLMPPRAFPT